MQFVQNNFYRTTAEDKPHHDKAFGYLVYCIGTKKDRDDRDRYGIYFLF